MQVEIVKIETNEADAGETLEFKLLNVDNSFANGLRRVLLAEVPTLAIDVVTVKQNTSVFPDEMLVHRLGLIPFKSEKARLLNYTKDCLCGGVGCNSCQFVAHLNVECPATDHSRPVFASDMISSDRDVVPVSASAEGVWIMTLGRGQSFQCKCYIRKGIAKLHSKWMPVATVAMQYSAEINLNDDAFARLDEGLRRQWVDRCPRRVFEIDEGSKLVVVKRKEDCIYCKECLTTEAPFHNLPEALVMVRQKRTSSGGFDFTFIVESTGVLPATQLIFDAIDILRRKLIKIRTVLNEGSTASTANIPTRRVGVAPTAPIVADQDVVVRADEDDNINFVNN